MHHPAIWRGRALGQAFATPSNNHQHQQDDNQSVFKFVFHRPCRERAMFGYCRSQQPPRESNTGLCPWNSAPLLHAAEFAQRDDYEVRTRLPCPKEYLH